MKRKVKTNGFVKHTLCGAMNGASMALSWMVSGFNIYGTMYCIKNKQYRSFAKWFAWLAAVATFDAVRNTKITYGYLTGSICPYDWTIRKSDEEEEEEEEVDEI